MELKTDVLVIGAGYGGLSTSLFLAQQGIDVLQVERHASTSVHPKASGQSWRSMELFRFAGIDEEVLDASIRTSQEVIITVTPSLGGPVLHQARNNDGLDVSAATAMPLGLGGQDAVEPIMLASAVRAGADVRFRTELVSYDQDADGVTALLRHRDTGEETTVRARYLVAADGNRSPIRKGLGIEFEGHSGLAHIMGVVFDADLGEYLRPETYEMYFLKSELFGGMLTNTERANRFLFGVFYDPAKGETTEDFTAERIVGLIRSATGIPALEPHVVATDPWEIGAQVAARFRDDRVFLVGDAAKVAPPSGGQGGNTAIGDGNNLAWKLAAVLRGEAGEALLDTYEAERRPIARLVVDISLQNLESVTRPEEGIAGLASPERTVASVLGFQYRSSAVLSEDDDLSPTENPLTPSGRPGFRAPDGDGLSLVDLLGHGWVLLARGGGWLAAAERNGVDHRVVPTLNPVYQQAALIRPDGIVAWRTDESDGDEATLRGVLAKVLSR